jgi:hypothetical protein
VQTLWPRRHITPRISPFIEHSLDGEETVETGSITGGEDDGVECLAETVGEHDAVFDKMVDARADRDPTCPDQSHRTDINQRTPSGPGDLCQRTVGERPQTESSQISEQQTSQWGVDRIRDRRWQ